MSDVCSAVKTVYTTLFPSTCACCGRVLVQGERQACLDCLSAIGDGGSDGIEMERAARRLIDFDGLGEVFAMCRYAKGGAVQRMVHAMKFHSNAGLCLLMGRMLGGSLQASGRFDGVDLVVPVPLHWLRRLGRGYNQSLLLARGVAEVMGTEVCEGNLVRHRYTRKQSRSSARQRASNVMGAFRVRDAKALAGKHILLVDDVMTTGATLRACGEALAVVPSLRVSVALFSMA